MKTREVEIGKKRIVLSAISEREGNEEDSDESTPVEVDKSLGKIKLTAVKAKVLSHRIAKRDLNKLEAEAVIDLDIAQ